MNIVNVLESCGSVILLNAQMMLLLMFIFILAIVFYYLMKIAFITTKWGDFEEWVKEENKEGRLNDFDR